MARTSLLKELVDRRRRYTREPASTAVPSIRSALGHLGRQDRDALVRALRTAPALLLTSRLGEACPKHVMQAVFPDAVNTAQQELEAALILAASRAVNHLHRYPPASLRRPASVFRSISPGADCSATEVAVAEPALGPLLSELLPFVASDEEVNGVPGLRIQRHRRCVELSLAQCNAPASVIIKDVDSRTWKAALAYVDASFVAPHQFIDCRAQVQPHLTREEAQHLRAFPRVDSPATGSALFRRHLALDRPYWIQVWTAFDAWKVERPSDVELSADALVFLDPVFGLKTAVQTRLSDASAYLTEEARSSAANGDGIRLLIRPGDHPGELDSSMVSRLSGSDAWSAWSAIKMSSQPGSAS